MKNLIRSAEFGFYLFIFLLPWQTRLIWRSAQLNGGYWEYGSLSLYGTELLLFALLIMFGITLLHVQRPVPNWKSLALALRRPEVQVYWLLTAFVLASGISVLWSLDWQLSYYAWVRLLEAMALLALIVRLPLNFIRIAIAWIASALLQSLFGIWQFFVQSTPANKWLGLAVHDAAIGGSIVLETGGERWLRAYGSLPHPNMLAGFLLLALLWVAYLLCAKEFSSRLRVLLLAGTVIITAGLFLTFSRSAWIAALLVLPWFGWWVWRRRPQARRAYAEMLAVVGLVVLLLTSLLPGLVWTRLAGEQRLEVDSLRLRVTFMQQAAIVARQSWPAGVGLGAYTLGVHRFVNNSWPFWYYQPAHNIYAMVAVETGLLGSLLGALSLGKLLQLAIRRSQRLESSVLVAGLCSLLLIGIVDHYLWTLYFGILLLWLTAGMLLRSLADQPAIPPS